MRKLLVVIAMATAVQGCASANAQNFPARPITMIVPFAAGGPTDRIGRIVAEGMRPVLGQPIVIEDVTGASGTIGVGRAVRAAPDGYTLSVGQWATHVLNGAVFALPYNVLDDFEPIALLTSNPQLIVANNAVPAKDLKELIAWLKANPGKASQGTAGAGTRVSGAFFQSLSGTSFTFVPYRGSAPAMQDLMGGRIDFVAEQISTALPQIQSNTVKAIATLGLERAPGLEQLPTAQEQGLPGLDCGSWSSLSFPKGTPDEIVRHLAKAVNEAVETPATRERFKGIGVTIPPPERRTPEYLAKFVPSEIERWAAPIKASGASEE